MKKKKQLRPKRKILTPKKCFFCEEKKEPAFAEIEPLQKFLTERGKIIIRTRTGLCARHQRGLTKEVKRARFLALLPFLSRE